ncbi:response regulator transcription factor [Aliarcobacter cryaerophilus]|uniref:Response regulator transcription factor n=2 Tax=Arcobacteraceae TaxID=2808963 RepID=A0AAU0P0A4_9BACT|nr:response regulator transcription factor [Aliarcobacter cryaerophilus]MCT7496709.1 response regulator transcription factor [Aliarcobacter cryaerophilus]WNL29436.1 response regulator transcription factor [Arcobacter sp. AZ-2023]WPD02278.1 response regulator transcription factor [Arcobacter sp. DSM 115972]
MAKYGYKILVIEDDIQIQKLFEISLIEQNFLVKICHTNKEAFNNFDIFNPDLVILDLGLPDGDGKQFIKQMRKNNIKIPIIVVSARNNEDEIVESLNVGADDYIVKPFYTKELIARISSALRRVSKNDDTSLIVKDNFQMDIEKVEFRISNIPIHLTPIEFNLLRFLMQNSGKVLTHTNILRNVWGINYQNDTKILRVFINQLRKKIEKNTNLPEHIITVSGIGYRFA